VTLCSLPDRRARAARRRARRGESGASLIEVLIGLGVMMPMTLAAAMGMLTATQASAATEQRQELQIALTTATENLKELPYLPCATGEEYQKAYAAWNEPLAAKVIDGAQTAAPAIDPVEYWSRAKAAYQAKCSQDDGAQRLTVTVTNGDRMATGTIVKRNPSARVGNSE
jgi:Tfp pilus assembly protein PilV